MMQYEGYSCILNYLLKLLIEKKVSPAGQLIVFTMHMDADARTAMYFGDPQTLTKTTGLQEQTVRNELQSLRKKGFVIYKSSNSPRYKKYFLPLCKLQSSRKQMRKSTLITPTWPEIIFRAKFVFDDTNKTIHKQTIDALFSDTSWQTNHFLLFSREMKNTDLNAEFLESFEVPESARRNLHKKQSSPKKTPIAKAEIKRIRENLK